MLNQVFLEPVLKVNHQVASAKVDSENQHGKLEDRQQECLVHQVVQVVSAKLKQ